MIETTAQKMKFSIKDFFCKCDQVRWKLRIWSHLLKKSLVENFIFCAVNFVQSLDLIIHSSECIPFCGKQCLAVDMNFSRRIFTFSPRHKLLLSCLLAIDWNFYILSIIMTFQ